MDIFSCAHPSRPPERAKIPNSSVSLPPPPPSKFRPLEPEKPNDLQPVSTKFTQIKGRAKLVALVTGIVLIAGLTHTYAQMKRRAHMIALVAGIALIAGLTHTYWMPVAAKLLAMAQSYFAQGLAQAQPYAEQVLAQVQPYINKAIEIVSTHPQWAATALTLVTALCCFRLCCRAARSNEDWVQVNHPKGRKYVMWKNRTNGHTKEWRKSKEAGHITTCTKPDCFLRGRILGHPKLTPINNITLNPTVTV